MEYVRVWAAGDARFPHPRGSVNGCRFVARDRAGEPIPEGAQVPLDSDHRRAIARGDLSTIDPRGRAASEE